MVLLAFAFLAGLVTVLAPCILPVLPIVLSGGTIQGKRRPWGIILGVILSFSFFTLILSWLVQQFGLSPNLSRNLGITIISVLGIVMLVPGWLDRFEGWMSSRMSRLNPNGQRHGFGGGLILGISLGAVWTPCAGPVLASVVAASQTGELNGTLVATTVAYAIGAAIPMGAIAFFGQRVLTRVRWFNAHGRTIQKFFGVVLVVVAISMATNTDRKIQTWIVERTPNWLNSLQKFEDRAPMNNIFQSESKKTTALDNYGPAPELTGITGWLNSQSTSLSNLRGKVVLVKFWTYSCINCIRTLPHVQGWYDTYHDDGFEIIAVHSPEFAFEKVPANVEKAVADFKITYPVALDPDFATWRAYQNRYWPAKYLIDATGNIRYVHFGEGDYDETERAIQSLLEENGLNVDVTVPEQSDPTINRSITPETYFGDHRRERFSSPETAVVGTTQSFSRPAQLERNTWALDGSWSTSQEYIEAGPSSSFIFDVTAKNVYLVMGASGDQTVGLSVSIDGQPSTEMEIAADSQAAPTLYRVAEFENFGRHTLQIDLPLGGIRLYSATFGAAETPGIACEKDGKCTIAP